MKKYILRISIALSAVLVLSVLTLAAHLYLVTPASPQHHQNWQLSRIDFQEPITDEKAQEMNRALKSIDGIKTTSINREYKNVVYAYETQSLNSQEVFAEFMTKGDFKAVAFKAPKLSEAGGCPVIDRESFTYRFSALIKKILPSS